MHKLREVLQILCFLDSVVLEIDSHQLKVMLDTFNLGDQVLLEIEAPQLLKGVEPADPLNSIGLEPQCFDVGVGI